MSSRSLGHLVSLVAILVLEGCAIIPTETGSRFAGCYDNSCVDAPALVPGVPAFTSITTMTSHSCGLTAAGDAWCWGDNSLGQLGDGTDAPRTAAVKVTGGLRFSSISAGAGFTCGLATDASLYCWGSGATAQLGQFGPDKCASGQVSCARQPLLLAGRSYAAVGAGLRHACAVDTSGATWCWGFNFLGETGSTAYGTIIASPIRVAGSNVYASLAGGDSFTCGLTSGGRAYCWGADNRGELGRAVGTCNSVAGFANYCSPTPAPVNSSATFTSLSVGNSHACGITASSTALCWGDNGQGQLGTSSFDDRMTPALAQGGMTFTSISASGAVTCGTPVGSPSVCWGLNLFGKLGVGSRIELSTTPLAIAGGRQFVSFAGGQYHVCALTAAGATYCWGSGREGELGTGVLRP